MDTQVNESFNNIAAWMAPKNKVYCGSPFLPTDSELQSESSR
jgi:hypothetical protein